MPKTIIKINEEITNEVELCNLIKNIKSFCTVVDFSKDNVFMITKDRCNHAITDDVDSAIEKIKG